MKKKIFLIEESLEDFENKSIKLGKLSNLDFYEEDESNDDFDEDESEESEEAENVDISDMTNAEEIDVEEEMLQDQISSMIENELKVPEYNRSNIEFRIKGDTSNIYDGVPMAKTKNKIFFKIDNKIKSFYIKDIIFE